MITEPSATYSESITMHAVIVLLKQSNIKKVTKFATNTKDWKHYLTGSCHGKAKTTSNLVIEESERQDVMTLGSTVSHAQVAERVSHQNDAVTVHQLLEVVGLVQCIFVLVKYVNQRAVEIFQHTLQLRQLVELLSRCDSETVKWWLQYCVSNKRVSHSALCFTLN